MMQLKTIQQQGQYNVYQYISNIYLVAHKKLCGHGLRQDAVSPILDDSFISKCT